MKEIINRWRRRHLKWRKYQQQYHQLRRNGKAQPNLKYWRNHRKCENISIMKSINGGENLENGSTTNIMRKRKQWRKRLSNGVAQHRRQHGAALANIVAAAAASAWHGATCRALSDLALQRQRSPLGMGGIAGGIVA